MAKAFFVVHNPEAYEKRPELLGFYVKTDLDGKALRNKKGELEPENLAVKSLEPGDRLVYYTRGDYLIRGIFEIEEKLKEDDKRRRKEWDPNVQFIIKPLLLAKTPVDFRNIIFSGKKPLDMFSHLDNVKRQWGMSVGGKNYLKKISQSDLQIFEEAIKGKILDEESPEEHSPEFARKHLEMQFKLVKIVKNYGYSVHVARNDKAKIMEKDKEILENIPDFHSDRITDIASRIDCVAFSEFNVPKILAEVVDTIGTLTDSLYRLNEVALVYPRSKDQRFLIIGPENFRNGFDERLQSSTFKALNDAPCTFYSYEEIDIMYKEATKTKHVL